MQCEFHLSAECQLKTKGVFPSLSQYTPEEKAAAMQDLRDMLAPLRGMDIDIKQERAERRVAKYERTD